MSENQPLHTKYRPQHFDDVYQKHVTRALGNAIRTGRIAPSIILKGHAGCGKTTVARIYAMAMNCRNRDGIEPCLECDSCLSIMSGASQSDVLEINAANKTGVNDMRDTIISTYLLPPMFGQYRVYLIDEAHKMSDSAQNALLKPLEEPPSHAKFILCTTEISKIIPTIQSRSHIFTFKRVKTQDIIEGLKSICKSEGWTYEDEALKAIALVSDGSPRNATKMLDQLCTDRITVSDVEGIIGATSKGLALEIVELTLAKKFADMIRIIDGLYSDGSDLASLAQMIGIIFMDIMRLYAGLDIDVPAEIAERMKNIARSFVSSEIHGALKSMNETCKTMAFRNMSEDNVLVADLIDLGSKIKRKA